MGSFPCTGPYGSPQVPDPQAGAGGEHGAGIPAYHPGCDVGKHIHAWAVGGIINEVCVKHLAQPGAGRVHLQPLPCIPCVPRRDDSVPVTPPWAAARRWQVTETGFIIHVNSQLLFTYDLLRARHCAKQAICLQVMKFLREPCEVKNSLIQQQIFTECLLWARPCSRH